MPILGYFANLGFAAGSGQLPYGFVVEPDYRTFYVEDPAVTFSVYMEKDTKPQVVVDWEDWLGGSTIASVAWDVVPGGSLTVSDTENTTTQASCYLNGGQWDAEYALQCKITTADTVARIESRTIRVNVQRIV